jgi:hypothetical protein
MIATAAHLERLMAFENSLDMERLQFVEGVPMWGYVRWAVARALYAATSAGQTPIPLYGQQPLLTRNRLQYIRNAVEAAWWPRAQRDILLVSTTISCVLRNGTYFNRLVEPFANELPSVSLIAEASADHTRKQPRTFPNIVSIDQIRLLSSLAARATRPHSADERRTDELVRAIRAAMPELQPNTTRMLRELLLGVARRLPTLRRLWSHALDRTQPKLLMVEGASYGDASHLLLWASMRGIVTAEHQHGLISVNHEAYNFGDGVARSSFVKALPQYVLAYGPSWLQGVRTPSRVCVIGNPDLSDAIDRLDTRLTPARPTVLFISAMLNPARYRQVVHDLQRHLAGGDVLIRFRPHPMERARAAQTYEPILSLPQVALDQSPTIHESIINASVVIGDFSTALFEATALGRPVAMLDGEQARQHVPDGAIPFLPSDRDALTFVDETLRSTPSPGARENAGLWAPHWRRSYREFVANVRSGQTQHRSR